jgi:hypothetical protein
MLDYIVKTVAQIDSSILSLVDDLNLVPHAANSIKYGNFFSSTNIV